MCSLTSTLQSHVVGGGFGFFLALCILPFARLAGSRTMQVILEALHVLSQQRFTAVGMNEEPPGWT